MPLLEHELARREKDGLLLRPTPLRVRWELADLLASDGHALRIDFTGSVRAIPESAERRMLEEVLLDHRPAVTVNDISAHFAGALRAAAARVAQQHAASAWVSDVSHQRELIEALKTSAASVAFACGLEVLPPYQATVSSPSFERQRLRQMQQTLAEQQAAGQVEHFQRAADLMRQFESLRAATPGLPPGRVLQQISAADRGAVLRTLLMASADGKMPQKLWAVSGPYLVEITAQADEEGRITPRPNLISLPPSLGPLRSVRSAEVDGRTVLLVGARSGFILVDPQKPNEPRLYHDASVETEHGFNRIVYWPSRRQFCGTHADAGLVCWDMEVPEAPRIAVRTVELLPVGHVMPTGAPSMAVNSQASYAGSMQGGGSGGPRNLTVLDESTLLFGIGGTLFTWNGNDAAALPNDSRADIVAILPDAERMLCVSDDGSIGVMDAQTRQWIDRQHHAGRVRAAGALPWLGTTRVLLAGDDGPIQCVGLDDPLVTHYTSPYRGLRMVAGSATLLAASSPDRQRVVLWNSWDGRQPAGELFMTSSTRHRITDLAFG